jgi:DNA-binding transcriptional ArsR family regulator
MSTDPAGVIVIDEASREMRRRLGPASWLLFEELLLAATPVGDSWQASVSVRILAERTGLSNDTVARAVARLRRAGLVTLRQERAAGLFATGVYELTIPNGITVASTTTTDIDQHTPTNTRTQLSTSQSCHSWHSSPDEATP